MTSRIRYFLVVLAVAGQLTCLQCAHADKCTQSDSGIRIQVDGKSIKDGQGNPINLRGIYTRATWLDSEQEVKWFKKWGINFVRILLTHDEEYWDVVNDGKKDYSKRCIVREENLRHMDERVKWLQDQEIYFIMEIHWRALGIDETFSQPELLKQQCTTMYKKLAERYSGNQYLIGFCMFSEIYVAPKYHKIYNEICTAIIDSVHEVDSSLIVSATGVQTSSAESLIDKVHIDRPNVIYDFHFYSPKMFTHYRKYYGDLRYPGWVADGWASGIQLIDMDYLQRKLQPVLDFSERWNVPVWCGEFGAFGNAPDNSSARWERDVYAILENHNVPWILWRWKDKDKTVPQRWKDFWQGTFEKNYVTVIPHGGPFAGNTMVKMDCTLKDAQIRYTTNDAEPDSKSAVYKGPFEITKDTTIKAIAFVNGITSTSVDTASFYRLDGRVPETPGETEQGLKYSYYIVGPNNAGDFEKLQPVKTGITSCFDRSVADRNNGIALKFTGLIEVPVDGLYYFYTCDAGGSKLFIADDIVVDNPNSRWISRRSGFVSLKAGKHPIKVAYWRADQGEVFYSKERKHEWLMVEYEGPGIARQTVPSNVLWHVPGNK